MIRPEDIPIERGVVVMDENPREKRSAVLFWVFSVVILGVLVAASWYAASRFGSLFFPSH